MTTIRPNDVLWAVSTAFRVPVSDIVGPRRKVKVVNARHAAATLLRTFIPRLSLSRIGAILGDRHHSTVIHSLRVTDSIWVHDSAFFCDERDALLRATTMLNRIAAYGVAEELTA